MASTLAYLRKAREWAYPQLTTSAFLEKGVLTPEEFVLAGDELVYKCPTWCWEGGDPKKAKSYLPPNKQYLITRNVPCQMRVSSMEQDLNLTSMGGGDGGDDDEWMVSSIIQQKDDDDNDDDGFDILDEDGEVVSSSAAKPSAATTDSAPAANKDGTAGDGDDDDDDEYADMDGFDDDNVLQDDAIVQPQDAAASNAAQGGDAAAAAAAASAGNKNNNDNLVKVRTYDLSITYDKYYQTPRVWMIGKNTNEQPLTGDEMMEDVISDYANKTVTMESHPHVSGPHASIHPCQHGKVMKAIVKNLIKATATTTTNDKQDGNTEDNQQQAPKLPSVENYLFIFLKFVSSMIPTINYDFTMDVTADTRK